MNEGVARWLILYATVSGHAEELAWALAEKTKAREGIEAVVGNLAEYPVAQLREERCVAFIVSTWGEGAPPPDGEEFWRELETSRPDLRALRFAVLALGSRAYTDFCGSGRRLDELLADCGAQRVLARVDCDVKLKDAFEQWSDALLKLM